MKRIKLHTVLLWVFAGLLLAARAGAENRIVLGGDTLSEFRVTDYLYILEDPGRSLRIENVILTPDETFVQNKTPNVNFGFTRSAYWVKFSIQNNSGRLQNLVFSIAYPFINHVDFFEILETRLNREIHTGELHPFNTRDADHRDFVFDLVLEPGHTYTYIIRVDNDGETLRLPLRLASYKTFMGQDSVDLILKGFFYGLLIFVVIFNVFLYVTIRDRLYIFYTLYVATLTLFIANTDGLSFQLFWPESPWWADRSTILFVSLSNLFLLLFTRQFLALDGLGRFVDVVLKALLALASLLTISSLLGPPVRVYTVMGANALSFFAIVAVIVIAVHALRKRVYGARFFLASFLLLMIGVVIYVLRNMGALPSNLLTGYGVKIGFVSEVLLLSFAASDRFRIMKENINFELEKMVRLRTHEIQTQKEEITAQRDEIEAQRDVATRQRDLIAQQKKELTDSIHYARNIQRSLLPSGSRLTSVAGECFVIYRPKDIVSGDFYWVARKDNRIAVAVADCTGHGIPGAFMSMLGISFLNELYSALWHLKTNEVLERLRDHIVLTLQQSRDFSEKTTHSRMRDGMDIALCIYNTETSVLQFSGANIPVYLVSKDLQGLSGLDISGKDLQGLSGLDLGSKSNIINLGGLYEIKADKMPIAIHERMDPFSVKEVAVSKGDCLYIMTDGVADQFGGPEGRKFMSKQIRSLILTAATHDISQQQPVIEKALNDWRGNLLQVDDVTIVGMKLG